MVVRSPIVRRFPSHHLASTSAPGQVSSSSLEIAAWRDARRPLAGVRAVAGGSNLHIPGSLSRKPTTDSSRMEGFPVASAPSSPASSAIDFLTLCRHLKTTKRKGWINHGIKGPESIADHMYRMALMALITADLPGVDRERCVKMAIVHDIAEAIVGDITPSDGVPKAEKSRREQAALDEMCKVLGGGLRADEIRELWEEYENNSSLEANLVKDFDKNQKMHRSRVFYRNPCASFSPYPPHWKLKGKSNYRQWLLQFLLQDIYLSLEVEMILQALEYESEHGKVLDEFFLSTAGKFQTETGKSLAAEVVSRRNAAPGNKLN